MARESQDGPEEFWPGLEGAGAGYLNQRSALHQDSKLCLHKQPMTMTCTHTQSSVAWALCPPPTGWVARALWDCSSSSISLGKKQNGPLKTKGRPSRIEVT